MYLLEECQKEFIEWSQKELFIEPYKNLEELFIVPCKTLEELLKNFQKELL